jgi:hypothetical protein
MLITVAGETAQCCAGRCYHRGMTKITVRYEEKIDQKIDKGGEYEKTMVQSLSGLYLASHLLEH